MRKLVLTTAIALTMGATSASANAMLLAAKASSECYKEVPNSNAFLLSVKKNKSGGVDLRYRKNKKNKLKNRVYNQAKADFSACMDSKMGAN